jgi:hypothetical protein
MKIKTGLWLRLPHLFRLRLLNSKMRDQKINANSNGLQVLYCKIFTFIFANL